MAVRRGARRVCVDDDDELEAAEEAAEEEEQEADEETHTDDDEPDRAAHCQPSHGQGSLRRGRMLAKPSARRGGVVVGKGSKLRLGRRW